MKRIDSVNARPDENGLGKAGFNDNADLPGQDATYITPDWFNTVQEELCNLLELRGISLNPESKRQLYDLLSTQTDLEALATEIENNFIRKNQIIDNLTTNDATKVASAKQVKILQDNKLDKTDLKDASTEQKGVARFATATEVANKTNVSAAITPANVGQTFGQSLSTNGWCRLPNGLIMQWGMVSGRGVAAFPIPFTSTPYVFGINSVTVLGPNDDWNSTSGYATSATNFSYYSETGTANWFAIGY